jgi:predicted nucleic acid-binding protein
MTTAAAAPDPVFVDTNVLVYAAISSSPFHGPAFARLDALGKAGVELWISRQVLREYLALLSRPQPYTSPLPAATLVGDVIRLQSQFRIAEDGPTVTANLLTLLGSIPVGGKQIHDANIVATMQAHGLRRLLTHNTTDFARFGALVQVEPLIPTP